MARFGYGYPSYIENPFQASCYDAMKYARQQEWDALARRQAAAQERSLAASRAANQPVYSASPSARPGSYSEAARGETQFKVWVWEAGQAETAREREAFKKTMDEANARDAEKRAREREAFEQIMAESRAKAEAEAPRRLAELEQQLAAMRAEETRRREASEKAWADARATMIRFLQRAAAAAIRLHDDRSPVAAPCGVLLLLGVILLCAAL